MLDFDCSQVSKFVNEQGAIMKKRKQGDGTFAYATTMWLKEPSKKTGGKKHDDYFRTAAYLKRCFGSKKIERITDIDVEKLIGHLRQQPGKGGTMSNSGINNYATTFNAIMNFAADTLKMIEKYPHWKKGQEGQREYEPTEEEVQRMVNELRCMGGSNHLRADMLLFAVHTGLRNHNVTNLKISDVAPDFSFARFHSQEMKNGKPFERPLNQAARTIVEKYIKIGQELQEKYSWLEPLDYVFVQSCGQQCVIGKPFGRTGLVNKSWRTARERANLPDKFDFHTLRHLHASILRRNGVSLPVIKDLLGHSDFKSVMRYQHVTSREACEASEKTTSFIAA